jgi:hypothetical protein
VLLHWFKSLFIDELWVFIHPQSIVFVRLTRPFKNGFKQQVVHKQVIDLPHHLLPHHLAIKSKDTNDWKILNQYLKQALKNSNWQGVMTTVIVSNHFARYAIIPWNNDLAIEDERQAYMQHCFNLAYGEPAKAWDLRMSEPDFGQPAMASAINRELLQVLHDVFAEAGMKLAAVHPQLVLAINQTVSQVKQQKKEFTFWLVAIQSERVCLTLLENGGWRVVKNVAIEADVSEQVTALMQREIVNCNVNADVPVLLYWPESHRNKPLKLTNHKAVKVLPHQFDMQNGQVSNSLPDWVLA